MNSTHAFLEIPVEVIQVVFRVEKEDPLRPLLETMNGLSIDSKLNSIQRLSAMSSSKLELSKDMLYPTVVLRDLWKGRFWTMKERNLDYTGELIGGLSQIQPIERLNTEKFDGNVKEIAKPFLGWLANSSNIERKDILGHIRLDELSCNSEVFSLKTRVILREDKVGRKFWIHDQGPFKQLVGEFIEEIEGFEMAEEVRVEQEDNWPYSPEVLALKRLKEHRNNPKREIEVFDQVIKDLQEDQRPRLNEVKPCVGFRQDMWDAAVEVIKTAQNRVYILTSFSNLDYIDDTIHHLLEGVKNNSVKITLAFGEPNRGRSPEDIISTENYIQKLTQTHGIDVIGGVTTKPSHAKLIVSDSGSAFISSCNLFSGSFDSGVLESGLILKDKACAMAMLEEVIDGQWISGAQSGEMEAILNQLKSKQEPSARVSSGTIKRLKKYRNNYAKGRTSFQRMKFEFLLRDIAERPMWSLLREHQHRQFMHDCIDRFEKNITLASDGLRSNGLDLATIQKLHAQADKHRATVRIWWGRHAPGSKPFDEIDKRGRKEAKQRLQKLSQLSNERKTWKLVPRYSHEPMETHAKLFIVDDLRLMVTSDNTLSFGDTMSERGDAGELGILIDHPRLSIQTRGSMELWLPKDAVIPKDMVRWWAALGEEVVMKLAKPTQAMLLEEALDSMIERIESSPHLSRLWVSEIEKDSDESQILNKLLKGTTFGMYRIRKSVESKKLIFDMTEVESQAISLAGKDTWVVSKSLKPDPKPKDSEKIHPREWSEAFVKSMKNPNEFEFVSDVLSRMLDQDSSLKLGSGKATKYITQQCAEYLESEKRDTPLKNSLYVRRRKN
ncbi:MAG: hypothetical protein DWC04_07080 [Candidatus Poseidoniales archaeon]|nr:MAG: hypothetical protein DWC04_07080 [Candidatus Poseidoniales archaeon]